MRVIGVFGSVARGEDRPDSDIDLLVELPPRMGLIGLGRLQRAVEELLEASVDVVPETDLKPGVRPNVEADLGLPVSRHDHQRRADVVAAIEAIDSTLREGTCTTD